VASFVELSMVIEGQLGPDAARQADVFLRRAAIGHNFSQTDVHPAA
jgi:ribonuclease VapC